MISLPWRRTARKTTPARITTAALMGTAATVATLVATDVIPVSSWALEGIDVASHQHPGGSAIDWQAVADAGHKFAFIKATEGTGYTNSYFATDSFKAEEAGLVPGSYHYARPGNDPRAEARHYASVLATGPQPSLPPALDLEEDGGLGATELQNWVREWVDEIKILTGRDPIIYTYYSFWIQKMGNTTEFSEYPLWLAYYSNSLPNQIPGGWDEATFWQYSGSGSVEGIQTDVDMNTYYGSDAQLQELAARMPEGTAAGDTAESLTPIKETVRTEAQVANTIEQATGVDVPLPSDFFMLLLGVIGGRLPAEVLLSQGAAELESAAGEWADDQKKTDSTSSATDTEGTTSADTSSSATGNTSIDGSATTDSASADASAGSSVAAASNALRIANAIAQALEEYKASGNQLTIADLNQLITDGTPVTVGDLLDLIQQVGGTQDWEQKLRSGKVSADSQAFERLAEALKSGTKYTPSTSAETEKGATSGADASTTGNTASATGSTSGTTGSTAAGTSATGTASSTTTSGASTSAATVG